MEMYRFLGCGGFANEVLILEAKAVEGCGGGGSGREKSYGLSLLCSIHFRWRP